VGAVCGKAGRTVLCGGRSATAMAPRYPSLHPSRRAAGETIGIARKMRAPAVLRTEGCARVDPHHWSLHTRSLHDPFQRFSTHLHRCT
jgi:hypothetical protein